MRRQKGYYWLLHQTAWRCWQLNFPRGGFFFKGEFRISGKNKNLYFQYHVEQGKLSVGQEDHDVALVNLVIDAPLVDFWSSSVWRNGDILGATVVEPIKSRL